MRSPLKRCLAIALPICVIVALAPTRTWCDRHPEDEERAAEEAQRHNNEGVQFARQGRYREAVEAFWHAVELVPRFAAAYYNVGLAQQRLGALGKAVAAFKAALQIVPEYADVWHSLARALKDDGRYGEAARAYRTALELRRNDPDIRYELGIVSWKLGDWRQVVVQWDSLLLLHPSHGAVPTVQENLPRAYFNLGAGHQLADSLDDAAEAYGRAIRLKPDYVEAHLNLGLVRRAQSRLPEAAAVFQQVLDIAPDNAQMHSELGAVYALMDSLDAALERYRTALEMQSDYLEARYGLADVHLRLGDVPRALRETALILERSPNDPRSHAFLAYVYEHNHQGERYGEGFRAREAIAAYEKALSLNPDDATHHFNIGIIHGRLGEWSEALTEFHRALAIDSTHTGVRKWLPEIEGHYRQEQAN